MAIATYFHYPMYSMYLQQEVRQPLTNTLVQQLPIGAFVFLVLEQTTIYVTLRNDVMFLILKSHISLGSIYIRFKLVHIKIYFDTWIYLFNRFK